MGVSKSFFSILIFGRKFITFLSLNFRKCWSFPSKMNQRGVFRVFFNIPRRNQYIAYWRLRSKLDIVLAGGARNIMYFQYYRDILVLITSLSPGHYSRAMGTSGASVRRAAADRAHLAFSPRPHACLPHRTHNDTAPTSSAFILPARADARGREAGTVAPHVEQRQKEEACDAEAAAGRVCFTPREREGPQSARAQGGARAGRN